MSNICKKSRISRVVAASIKHPDDVFVFHPKRGFEHMIGLEILKRASEHSEAEVDRIIIQRMTCTPQKRDVTILHIINAANILLILLPGDFIHEEVNSSCIVPHIIVLR